MTYLLSSKFTTSALSFCKVPNNMLYPPIKLFVARVVLNRTLRRHESTPLLAGSTFVD